MAQHRAGLQGPTATVAGSCLALLIAGTSLAAADPEVAAIDRSRMLLAARGHRIAPVVVVENWPSTEPSDEAFAGKGKIYVNARSNVLRAAVLLRAYDVVLASLLLHEQSHLLGASEQQALEAELEWLTSERAGNEFIQATRRSIEREKQKQRRPQPRSREGRYGTG